MRDREKVIKGLEICSEHGSWHGLDCEHNEAYKDCPYRGCETGCVVTIAKDALALLKEQEAVKPMWEQDSMVCGVCGHDVIWQKMLGDGIWGDEELNYCPYCGRKVKWDEID